MNPTHLSIPIVIMSVTRVAAIMAAFMVCPGCSEELGPERIETTRVRGRLLLDNRPVEGGWLELIPVDGTVGSIRSAPIGKDGRFEFTKVAVGRSTIRLVHPPLTMPGRTIAIKPYQGSLSIDMNVEVREYQRERQKRRATIRTWPPSARGSARNSQSE